MDYNNIETMIGRVSVQLKKEDGDVLATIICRGLDGLLEGLSALHENYRNFGNVCVEVESINGSAIILEVVVMEGTDGISSLVPTELHNFDANALIEKSDLRVEKMAMNFDVNSDILDKVVEIKMEDRDIPANLATGLKHGNIRRLNPPYSLSHESVSQIRYLATRVFKEMGLKHFAKFTICVTPDTDPTIIQQQADAVKAFENGESLAPETAEINYSFKSFSELIELDQDYAAARREAEAKALEPVSSVTSLDSTKTLPESEVFSSIRYGEIFDVPLDDRTRVDISKSIRRKPVDPIPESLPEIKPAVTNHLSNLNPSDLCSIEQGSKSYNIFIQSVDIVPDFGNLTSGLVKQVVASGISWSWVPRRLVSLAAKEMGLPSLTDEQVSKDEIMDADEAWAVDKSTKSESEVEESIITLEEIGETIKLWEQQNFDITIEKPLSPEQGSSPSLDVENYEEALDDTDEMESVLEKSVATLNELDNGLMHHEMSGVDAENFLSQQFPGLHPRRQRVWILCGGEGTSRDHSLEAAASAMKALQGAPDLLLETFILDPPYAGAR